MPSVASRTPIDAEIFSAARSAPSNFVAAASAKRLRYGNSMAKSLRKPTKRPMVRKVGKRRSQTTGIASATGATTLVPFGNRQRAPQRVGASNPGWFNANSSAHLSLPRAILPYTVSRVTASFSITGPKLAIFGPMKHIGGATGADRWTNVACVSSVAPGTAIGGAANTTLNCFEMTGFDSSSIVPSAFTVQIMNTNALQTTDGLVLAGRAKQILKLYGSTQTWTALGANLLQFTSPRMLSGPALAMLGVGVDAIPGDMNDLADFTPIDVNSNGNVTWGSGSWTYEHTGFAPVWVDVPDGLALNFVVTMECRTRFDPFNPAHSSHTYHPPAPQAHWDAAIRAAVNNAHGVLDIAQRVATLGSAAYAAGRALPALAAIAA